MWAVLSQLEVPANIRNTDICLMFPVKNDQKKGGSFLLFLFTFAFESAIRKAEANKKGFKLNGTHQVVVYGKGVNLLGKSMHVIKKQKPY